MFWKNRTISFFISPALLHLSNFFQVPLRANRSEVRPPFISYCIIFQQTAKDKMGSNVGGRKQHSKILCMAACDRQRTKFHVGSRQRRNREILSLTYEIITTNSLGLPSVVSTWGGGDSENALSHQLNFVCAVLSAVLLMQISSDSSEKRVSSSEAETAKEHFTLQVQRNNRIEMTLITYSLFTLGVSTHTHTHTFSQCTYVNGLRVKLLLRLIFIFGRKYKAVFAEQPFRGLIPFPCVPN